MSIIIIYLLCFFAMLAVYCTGTFLRSSAMNLLSRTKGKFSSNLIIGGELLLALSKQAKLKNLTIIKLKAKKTNYYSFKYNVIKLSPVTHASYELSQLSIVSHCYGQAKLSQNHSLFYMFRLFFNFVSKLVSALFLPILLICAIINVKSESAVLRTILLITMLLFLVCFIIQLLDYLINVLTAKKIVSDLKSTNLLTESEIEIMSEQLRSICKIVFYDYSRFVFVFLKLASPDILFQINSEE